MICSDGRVAVDGSHCCWPGQSFVGDECRGTPTCTAPYEADGDKCMGPPDVEKRNKEAGALADDARARARVAWGGAGFASILGFMYYAPTTKSVADLRVADWHAHFHLPATPLELYAGAGAGSYRGPNEQKTSVSHYTVGAAFAPLSFPNAANDAFSIFNPSIGIALHRVSVTDSILPRTYKPESNTSFVAELANTILLHGRAPGASVGYGVALRFGYLQRLSGESDFAPTHGFFFGLMAGPVFDHF